MKKNFRFYSKNGLINFSFDVLKYICGLGRKYSTIKDSNLFLAPIPVEYVRRKGKPIYYQFGMKKFHLGIYDVTKRISKDVDYTVYIKVKHSKDQYFMAGNQFGFIYSSIDDINDLYDLLSDRLNLYFKQYKLVNKDIVYVEVTFREFNTRLLSEFSMEDFKHKHLIKTILIFGRIC